MIGYTEFRDKMHPFGCFSVYQAKAQFPLFGGNSLTRWVKKGLLVRLRQGWYAFPDMISRIDFARFLAGRIYRPSYISLHTALSYYGMIPESVTQITSVTTLKTASFENPFGQYAYKSVKEHLFFGYRPMEMMPIEGGAKQSWFIAEPEKALLDLLYLYPFYNTEEEMQQLRLDEDYIADELNVDRLMGYMERFDSGALRKRVKLFLKVYGV